MNPSDNNGSAVIVQDVRKVVRKVFVDERQHAVAAVDRLSLEIRRGEIFTLVGPDGAGKTTTIRMMCGVLPPTEGTIRILGKDMRTEREAVKRSIGYLSQRFSLYGDLTIDENIDFFAEIHRLQDFRSRKEELLDFMRLTPFRGRLAERLSGGMKQKLALACTLIHTPQMIFLDEPTTGVDPVSRRDFWKILSAVLKSGVTIVMATPYLDEAERSTRVALIQQGRLLMCDTPRMLCGLLEPSSGDAIVGGVSVRTDPDAVKANIGYMSQRFSLYEDLTVEQNINFYGGIYGLESDRLRKRKAWVLEMAGLVGKEQTLRRNLSGGWKQRLALGCAILHEPPIVFFDEPTGGIDPVSRRNFWEWRFCSKSRGWWRRRFSARRSTSAQRV